MDNSVIRLVNVSKKYKLYESPQDRLKEALHPLRRTYHKDFWALQNVNIELRRGEVLGIVGRNGSGKSTLLKVISGILQPSSGSVDIDGEVSALLEVGSGMNPEYSGMENIYFLGSVMGHAPEEMEGYVEDIAAFAELGDFMNQPVKNYSSGMIARLSFAISTSIKPEILILDEVLSVGDTLFRRKAYTRMERLLEGDTTVLFVSHSDQSIMQVCTDAILLNEGELLYRDTPKEVIKAYTKLNNAAQESRKSIVNNLRKREFQQPCGESDVSDVQRPQERTEFDKNYIEGFVSKSAVVQKNADVDIYDIKILTEDGKVTNHLETDKEYVYEYKVTFGIDAENLSFGAKIKSERGLFVSALRPDTELNRLEKAAKNTTYLIQVRFTNRLLHGIYYLNAGVSEFSQDNTNVLHQIQDAYVFKVMKPKKPQYNGLTHFDQTLTINRL